MAAGGLAPLLLLAFVATIAVFWFCSPEGEPTKVKLESENVVDKVKLKLRPTRHEDQPSEDAAGSNEQPQADSLQQDKQQDKENSIEPTPTRQKEKPKGKCWPVPSPAPEATKAVRASISADMAKLTAAIEERGSSQQTCKTHFTHQLLDAAQAKPLCIPAGLDQRWLTQLQQRWRTELEPKTNKVLCEQIRKLKQGDVVLEAGMHVGDTFLLLARLHPNVNFIGVDPARGKVDFIRSLLVANNIRNAMVFHGGLGSYLHGGRVTAKANNPGAWKVADADDSQTGEHFDFFTVDELTAGKNLRLLHLDVEGFELDALLGACKAMEEGRVGIMLEAAARHTVSKGDQKNRNICVPDASKFPPFKLLSAVGYRSSWSSGWQECNQYWTTG